MTPEGALCVSRAVYGGRLMEDVVLDTGVPAVLTLRPNLFPLTNENAVTPEVEFQPVMDLGERIALLSDVLVSERKQVPLTEAEVVVSGGLGMGGGTLSHLIRACRFAWGSGRRFTRGGGCRMGAQILCKSGRPA